MKHMPNAITIGRIAGVPFLVLAILDRNFPLAFILAMLMGASDALDGFLAKRFACQSRLGEQLDPLADKLMLLAAFITLTAIGLVPLWFTVLVSGRDFLLILGAGAWRFAIGSLNLRPSLISKINTFLQIILVFCVLGLHGEPQYGAAAAFALMCAAAATTVVSAVDYARSAMQSLQQRRRPRGCGLATNAASSEAMK